MRFSVQLVAQFESVSNTSVATAGVSTWRIYCRSQLMQHVVLVLLRSGNLSGLINQLSVRRNRYPV